MSDYIYVAIIYLIVTLALAAKMFFSYKKLKQIENNEAKI